MLKILIISTFLSLFVAMFLIHFSHLHERFTLDHDLGGVQKFHALPVPRVGGLPLAAGLLAGCGVLAWSLDEGRALLFFWVGVPAFIAGLVEDMTKKVGPLPRLFATFAAAGLGYFVLGAGLHRVDIPFIDSFLVNVPLVSFLFTVIAVGGVAHAVNIIDGYNGLSGVVAVFIFLAMAYVAFKVQDVMLLGVCFAMIGALSGFLFWNFPRGLIFAGDGGAYLLGFMIAEVAVLLVGRHPQVSPWFPLLCVIYPVFETLYSIYRKKFLRGISPGMPDGLHLHMLVYKRLVRWMVGSKDAGHLTLRNSLTSPYLWALSCISVVPAMLFWRHTYVLMGFCLLFTVAYVSLYRMIIRFRTPRWLVLRRSTSSR
ncbi:MraY family glycosyltransferase [Chromobacterium sphagni]|uniref:Glycosyl transferase n=1 Tax=Chromobacterium sphagni TaxID=1903179 RepID=A0A1S1X6F4_9NEIS|nr:glycosyltransferase [Chromobacterium sphagni]OHX14987.1 glycosyl transferase [Chromobacterium sphagni]OHX20822.1 glycosyl transferase [Chromobacterium sphagni]